MSNQWPPTPPNYGGYPPTQPPPQKPSNAKWYATIAGLIVVIGGLLAVTTGAVAIGGQGDALEIAEAPIPRPVFEPAGNEGADPFFPLDVQLAGFEQDTGQAPTQQAVATGLYGGTAQNTCDPQRLIDYLMSNPAKGQAWAQVQGIPFDQIPSYINSLSVRVLAAPTTVLNHGFDRASNAPYEIETTLDAGTAVLVDAKGDVRARCYCGNPIKPKPIGHKPPRCVVLPHMVFTEPGGSVRRDGVPVDVFLTGRISTDAAWSEIMWGQDQMGWTPSSNLGKHICAVILPPPPTPWPTTEPTWTPTPHPTTWPTPRPTTWPTPHPTTWPTPVPTTWPTPPPTTQPTPWPTTEPTPFPQPLQINCFITDTDLMVGEQTEFSAFHVPDSVQVTYAFDHGDGTIDRRNPSFAFYEAPGSYDVYVLAEVQGEGGARRNFCGTVTVKSAEPIRLGCSIDNIRPGVGETITLTARSIPEDPSVRFVFDHGDGYEEEANPSFAVYRAPGDYDVRVTAYRGSDERSLFCGTVSVSGTQVCSTSGYEGLTESQAGDLAESRSCAWRVTSRAGVPVPGTTDYREDRVNFAISSHGRVTGVSIG